MKVFVIIQGKECRGVFLSEIVARRKTNSINRTLDRLNQRTMAKCVESFLSEERW